ncbi:hypothetical protein HNP73_002638 [Amaricoccus macauensis]|uniref:Acyloxyacyl hydrolase n=1 Tax=Amaricoccus macauensis TaxID=57001 RepID=A0A840SU67_9RHOB|nr:hypothetical protein [Amaricoccus macauensis]MBB5222702.1 hypothetical protein [Amaricoccus macauensis]
MWFGRLFRGLGAGLLALAATPAAAWTPASLIAPCEGDCAVSIYGGTYVENAMAKVLVTRPEFPASWDYTTDDHLIATAISREAGWLWDRHVSLEPEVGIGQRFGRQKATEVWGALFVRYHGFPWDGVVRTTVAVSTGLNWASDKTAVERDRNQNDEEGSHVLHFLAPEVTFSLPSHPGAELLFRMHHRSGIFGLINGASGGAQYATVGLRLHF